jgi:hypothetical protein
MSHFTLLKNYASYAVLDQRFMDLEIIRDLNLLDIDFCVVLYI